jgi:uncharacterized protein YndB with AHSA1/START domain
VAILKRLNPESRSSLRRYALYPPSSAESGLPSGERVLRHEVDLDAFPAAVWRAFNTSEGLQGFVAAIVSMELRPGGFTESAHDTRGHLGDPANIRNEVIAYVPERMLTMRIAQTPPNFPHPEVARQVWSVIEIADLGHGRSHFTGSMCVRVLRKRESRDRRASAAIFGRAADCVEAAAQLHFVGADWVVSRNGAHPRGVREYRKR